MDEYVRLLGEPLGAGAGVPITMPGVIYSALLINFIIGSEPATTITKTAKQAAKKATLV